MIKRDFEDPVLMPLFIDREQWTKLVRGCGVVYPAGMDDKVLSSGVVGYYRGIPIYIKPEITPINVEELI